MKIETSDPELETLYNRIKSGRLDLQPNFQRGVVWSDLKKQKLIDTVIREWHIPPVHFVKSKERDAIEVLDGQQRLVSIVDFIDGRFTVNGNLQPISDELSALHGMRWADLPTKVRARINESTIRVLTITDYLPNEPGELFYRLNSPSNLSTAEQRNAYFGQARDEVKIKVEELERQLVLSDLIGFSNLRMAYDDVILRLLLTLEHGTLSKKISASIAAERFRQKTGFSPDVLEKASKAIALAANCINSRGRSRLNKASFYSWLVFFSENDFSTEVNCQFFNKFQYIIEEKVTTKNQLVNSLVELFENRASSRVADVSSVKIRHLVLWLMAQELIGLDVSKNKLNKLYRLTSDLDGSSTGASIEAALLEFINYTNWDYSEGDFNV